MMKREDVSLRQSLRFVWKYWQRTPLSVAAIALGISGAVAFDIILPSVSKSMVQAINDNDKQHALLMVGAFVGCGAGFAISWQLGYRWLCKVTVRHMSDLLQEGFAKVQRASTDWHANTFAGSTVRGITRGMHAFDRLSDTVITGLLETVLLVSGTLILMWTQNAVMGAAATLSIALYVAASIMMVRWHVAPSNRAAVKHDTLLSATLADAITCNAAVKAFGAEVAEEQRLNSNMNQWEFVTLKSWLRRQDMYGVMNLMSLLNQLALIGTPVWLWQRGQADASDVAYSLTAFYLVNGVIRNVANIAQNIQQSLADLADIVLLDLQQLGIEDRSDALPAYIPKGEVRFEKVGFRYNGQSKSIYDNLTLTIRAGETVGLVGASGSGKSTFVKLLQRLYDVTDGVIRVDGTDIRHLSQSSLRQRIALVPQEPVLFHRSLLDNIRYARPSASEAEVEAAARQAHAHEFIARLPDGYATLVGERGVKLSGGERQRVAIARAILSNAPILVLDEATSSLDSVSEALIQDALDHLTQGRTTLIVAHRLSTLRSVDRILVFEQGRIVESGRHDDLLDIEGGHYRQLYETQQLGGTLEMAE